MRQHSRENMREHLSIPMLMRRIIENGRRRIFVENAGDASLGRALS